MMRRPAWPTPARFFARAVLALLLLACASCAATIPKAEIDRCNLGVADRNDSYTVRQGAACGLVAKHYAADDRPADAVAYARKACQLEDPNGCAEYLSIVRAQPSLQAGELLGARAAGEKACAGLIVGADGTDARPDLCARTAELYLDLEPRSTSDAGRLYGRACKLGDGASCARAKSLGVDPDERPAAEKPKVVPMPLPQHAPLPVPPAHSTAAPPPPPCHELRDCVSLALVQRNVAEISGTLTNHCDRAVACVWCPSRGDQVDKSACRSATLSQNESKSGREAGLWYEGYKAMAYDCMAADDDKACLSTP